MEKIKLNIEGIKCEGCINRIKNVLKEIKGIEEVNLSLETKTLTFCSKKDKITKEVIEKVENLGFKCNRE